MRRRRASPPRPCQPSLIAEIPHDERPRERLLRNGPQSLSDAELIAEFLAKKAVTVCATRYADGAVPASGYYSW